MSSLRMRLRGKAGGEAAPLIALRRHTINSLVVSMFVLTVLPFFALWRHRPDPLVMSVLVGGTLLFLALHARRIMLGLDAPERRTSLSETVVSVALAAAMAGLGMASGERGWVWLVLPGVAAADAMLGKPQRAAMRTCAVVAAVTSAIVVVFTNFIGERAVPGELWEVAVISFVAVPLVSYAEQASLWRWRSAKDLDLARRTAGQLATARERLRLAEDLHDVLGHTLELVALKSEVAARISDQDPSGARAEMAEVQRLARNTINDMRDMVRNRQRFDLVTELRSTQELLEAAGIDCVVRGDENAALGELSEILGRALREAVTNLLRHADPSHCEIVIEHTDSVVRLRVTNNGVPSERIPASSRGGTGLAALERRLGEVNGVILSGRGDEPGTFFLDVTVPVHTARGRNA